MSAVGTAPDATALDSPYIGLKPYTQENAVMFFGRDREQTVLISNLRAARLTLLYAQSGAGKSSLLRAGVAVRLTELARRDFDQRGNARNIPVVFSSWQDDPTAELIGGIQKAIIPFLRGGSPPEPAPDRLDQAIEAASRATDAALLVILDQFEDYFPHQSREMPNQPFANELVACINRADLRVKFLISIREDAYSFLGDLFEGRISNVYGNYFHLEHLTRQAAQEAIEKPIESFNKLHTGQVSVEIEPGLIDVVLDQLSQLMPDQDGIGRSPEGNGAEPHRDEVAAPYLQLVMKRLWDTELGKSSRTLRRETLRELGDAEEIVRTHIDRVLGNLPDEQREAAVDILQRLVTPSGTRIALSASDLADPDYTGRPVDEVNAALQRLVGSDDRILGTVPASSGRPGGTRYEIAHDLLVPAILDWSRRRRAARLEGEKEAAERQAQIEKRRARMFGALAIGSAALLVLVIVLAIVVAKAEQDAVSQSHLAQSEEHNAVSQSHLAQSEEMAAEATNLLSANGPLAMLLSLQAYERAHSLRAESALIQASQQPLDDLLVSGSPVNGVAFSPDGHTLAVGDEHGDVGLWNVATGRRTATLAEVSSVYGVAFSPDGHTVAVGDAKGDIRLWNVATGRRTATLPEGTLVNSVAFSPNGHTLAAGDNRGDVGLWNVATGRRTATLAGGTSVQSVKFSPDGHTLAIGDVGGNVGLWNLATRQRTATLAEGSPVNSVAFSPDGHTLAIGDAAGHVGLWNPAIRQRTATLVEGSPAFSVAFSPNGQTLAAGDGGDHVGLWNLATRQRTVTLAEGNLVQSVAFSPDGQAVAAGDAGGDVGLWDVATGRAANLAEGNIVNSVAFSPNGQTLAAGDAGHVVGLWDVTTGQRTSTLPEGSTVESVAFSPDGQTLAVGDAGGDIGLWDVATGRRIAILAERTFVYSVAFSPDGQTLAAGDASGDVRLWDVTTRRAATLTEGSPVYGVAFSRNGQTLAAGDVGGHIGLWDVATGQRTATLTVGSTVESVALSPDGQTLAAGDFGGHIGLWDVATGQRTATLPEGNPVYSVAFNPSGPILVTGDSLGDVDFWNTATRQRFANLVEGNTIASLAFPPHGQVLAIAVLSGNTVLVWQDLTNLTQQFFTHLICGEVRGNMTRSQWAEYAPGQPYQKTCP